MPMFSCDRQRLLPFTTAHKTRNTQEIAPQPRALQTVAAHLVRRRPRDVAITFTGKGLPVSLRMNLHGWSLPAFKQALERKDAAVLEKATSLLCMSLPKEPANSQAQKWLRTFVAKGKTR